MSLSVRGVAVLSTFKPEVRTAANGSSFIDLRLQVGTDDRPTWVGAKLFSNDAAALTKFRDELATHRSVIIEGPASARVNVFDNPETGERRESISYSLNLGRVLGFNRSAGRFLPLSIAFLGVTPRERAEAVTAEAAPTAATTA